MRVLGIDVGLRVTGYVVCDVNGGSIELIDQGQISTGTGTVFSQRLGSIYDTLSAVVSRYSPQGLILEKLYSHHRHPTTLGVLAQIRGIAILLGYQKSLDIFEYAPTRARKALLGKGSADSFQVKKMIEANYGYKMGSEHIADAFSLAVTFSHARKIDLLKERAGLKK